MHLLSFTDLGGDPWVIAQTDLAPVHILRIVSYIYQILRENTLAVCTFKLEILEPSVLGFASIGYSAEVAQP